MAKIEITKTELVWPGKYDQDGKLVEPPRVNLPFQVVETINQSRASREAAAKPQQVSLFDVWKGDEGETFEDGWKNKLIWGDNLPVMSSLLERFAGKVDLIYIDPPFATGADFAFRTSVGGTGDQIAKEPSALEEKAYRDTWGAGINSYLTWLQSVILGLRELLCGSGSMYLHLEPAMARYGGLIMDAVFGRESFRNEIAWKRANAHNDPKRFGRVWDSILYYARSPTATWQPQHTEYREDYYSTHFAKDEVGRYFRTVPLDAPRHGAGSPSLIYDWKGKSPAPTRTWAIRREIMEDYDRRELLRYTRTGTPTLLQYADDMPGVPLQDVWTDVPPVNPQAAERVGYPTQKPEALLDRILRASSTEGSLVLDCVCGSGTTLAVAEKLGRRWIGCDLGRFAIHTTRKRLLGIEGCKPFEVLNLGKYERQYWQTVTFGRGRKQTEQTLLEYIALILKLYRAEPFPGSQYIHGKLGNALVHVGSIDSPVTIEEINDAIDEAKHFKATELHVLGWEWEMGLNDIIDEEWGSRGIRLRRRQIPRDVMEEQAVDKGDVVFYELAYLEAAVVPAGDRADLPEGDHGQPQGQPLRVTENTGTYGQPLRSLTVQVELRDFAIRDLDLIPEDVRAKITKWSDYIDYWAVDWDFQNDTFMNGWQTYRTRKDRRLALSWEIHQYDQPGHYSVMVKVVDVFGNDTSRLYPVDVP